MSEVYDQVAEIAAVVRQRYAARPRVGIVLGTGLGGLAAKIAASATFDYTDLPHVPHASAIGHRGRLVCGQLVGVEVIAMQGRLHGYEGHTQQQLTLLVRVMRALGAEVLIVSNAAGGLNPNYQVGDLMALDDHINLLFDNPLVGENDDRLGPRWPDMSQPYCPQLAGWAAETARQADVVLHHGVYVAVRGPNYETRAEQRYLRRIGGDCVGMSTVPEVIVAIHGGMRVLGLSVVTNVCRPDAAQAADGHEVIATGAAAAERVERIVTGVLTRLLGNS